MKDALGWTITIVLCLDVATATAFVFRNRYDKATLLLAFGIFLKMLFPTEKERS